MVAQAGHGFLERHEGQAEPLDLLVGQVARVDPAQGLALHELAQQLHDREDQAGEAALDVLRVGVEPLAEDVRLGHRVGSRYSASTEVMSVRREMCTRSMSATDRV